MSPRFEQLAASPTPMGEISLRRRRDPAVGVDVYEVKLGDEFLMSSLFTVAEEELARRALARVTGDDLRVLVGGLGLGYTARAALEDPRVASLVVVDVVEEVIAWHRDGLLPEVGLSEDDRVRLLPGDVFALVGAGPGPQPDVGADLDAVLIDVDHSPRHVLADHHAELYTPGGLKRLAERIRPCGVFGLWSDDPPDQAFLDALASVFDDADAEVVRFGNPVTGGEAANTVYLGTRPTGRDVG